MELLKTRAQLDTTHIPYPGNPQVITALIAGQLQAGLLPPGLALQQVRAGKLKAVGVTSEGRSPLAPDEPTLRELDIRGADLDLWSAVAGPSSLPKAIIDKLCAAVIAAVQDADTRQRLLTAGWQPTPSNYEGLSGRIKRDTKTFGGIIMMRNIRSDA
jgi:tripartite-type tricarboxylate transporter receptor subunit TctC